MLRPRPEIEKLPPAAHGGLNSLELERLGFSPEDILDFSVSTNPFGPPPGTAGAIRYAVLDRYPDSESTALRLALASRLGVSADNILAGSGSTELIRLAATAYFSPGDTVVIPQPTYGEYELACGIVAARVVKLSGPEENGFCLKVSGLVDLVKKLKPKGVFLCNPNNPTGQYLSNQEVTAVLDAAGESLVVLDEAYIAFTEDPWVSTGLIERGNLVIVRSMTKDYALAGLRLGYAIAAEPVISVLKRVRPPWNVSAAAQAAGVFVLKDGAYLDDCRAKTRQARDFLVEGLRRLGFAPLPSNTNFFLVKVGDAAGFRRALLCKGIQVRNCASFGLSEYIRLAPRPVPDCRRLLAAIKEAGLCHDG